MSESSPEQPSDKARYRTHSLGWRTSAADDTVLNGININCTMTNSVIG